MTKRFVLSASAFIMAALILGVVIRPVVPHQPAAAVAPTSSAIPSPFRAATSTSSLMQATGTTAGRNRSSLHLASGGDMILLTDALGRQTGYDVATARVVQQIPDSNFSAEGTTNIEDVNNSASVDYFIDVNKPLDGQYQLTVIAGASSYDVTMVAFSADGARQSAGELKGSMISGSDRVFQINFTSAVQASSTVQLIR